MADRTCSFCGTSQREAKALIAHAEAAICDACVGLCIQILVERATSYAPTPEPDLPADAGLIERAAPASQEHPEPRPT